MRTRPLLVVSLLVVTVGFAPAPFPRAGRGPATDLSRMQGEWVMAEQRLGGQKLESGGDPLRVKVVGNRWSFSQGGKVRSEWDVRLDPAATPATMDMDKVNGVTRLPAIYRFDEGKLVLCYVQGGEQRPTTFDAEGARWLLVLKRP